MNASTPRQPLRSADESTPGDSAGRDPQALIALEDAVCARNYAPSPVVVSHAHDVWVHDVAGRRYLDFMSAYSAVSHGHGHPRLVAAARAQIDRVCVTSRAYHSDTLGAFAAELCRLSGFDRMLPMNTGAEAVETAIKAARRWGYRERGIAPDRAVILVADGNFHGRTSTIIGFSSEPSYREGFGPFAPAFRHFRFGDLASMDAARDDDVCAVLVEPIQGEAGIVVPPRGWLRAVRDWCDHHRILLILDEVQSGLGRTGRMFAFEHEGIRPDGLVLGKALGGGIMPVSAFVADDAVMRVFSPGSHGSTFGGNALASAVGLEALRVLQDEQLPERSAVLGRHLIARLQQLAEGRAIEVRGVGLWAGVDLRASGVDAARAVGRLAELGVLSKETHDTVIRIAPPLTIRIEDLDWGIDRIAEVLDEMLPRGGSRSSGRGADTRAAATDQAGAPTSGPARVLMCAPEHFEVSYRINPWMRPDQWASDPQRLARQAASEWQGLRATLLGLGAQVETLPAQPGLPDLVFTANSAVVLDRKAVLARFRSPERRGEEAHDLHHFEAMLARGELDEVHLTPEGVFFEGAGDAIWDRSRKLLWLGYGPRSSFAARDTLRRVFDVDTVSLELATPRFYHLDTCLCVLPRGEILWLPDAFTPQSRALLRGLVGEALIDVDDANASRFAINSVAIGDDLVMSHCSPELRARLEALGYRVTTTPLDAFNLSGGAAFCLTLRLDNRSAGAPFA